MSEKTEDIAVALFGELFMADQLARNRISKVLPKGMELSHFGVLNHLARVGDERTPAQLARAFHVTRGAMTNTLTKLEWAGHIHIRPDWDDARRKFVAISDSHPRGVTPHTCYAVRANLGLVPKTPETRWRIVSADGQRMSRWADQVSAMRGAELRGVALPAAHDGRRRLHLEPRRAGPPVLAAVQPAVHALGVAVVAPAAAVLGLRHARAALPEVGRAVGPLDGGVLAHRAAPAGASPGNASSTAAAMSDRPWHVRTSEPLIAQCQLYSAAAVLMQ